MSAESINQFLEIQYLIDKIICYDNNTLKNFIKNSALLQEIETDLSIQLNKKQKTEKKLQKNIELIKKEAEEKKILLTRIKKEKSLKLAAVKALEDAAKTIDKRIASLNKEKSYSLKNKLNELSFEAYKGLLEMPIKGKIISKFGTYYNKNFNVKNYSSGITIEAKKGEPVYAIFDGNIIFADWLKGYGNIIIIDHGKNYYTLYAHMEKMLKKSGESVEIGDILANVGNTGFTNRTKLYFEIRYHGKPINPMNWFKKS